MIRIVYVSAARRLMSESELDGLLADSRVRNGQREVTGMLLYKDGSFMQAIEGAEETIETLFDRIARDPRHGSVRRLTSETIEQRMFGDWTMAFRRFDGARTPGHSRFLEEPLVACPDPANLAATMLDVFRRNM